MMLEISHKNVLEIWRCQLIWHLIAGFKNIFLWSVHSLWLVKYMCSAKIWFEKTSNWIVKYESRVAKSNPDATRNIWAVIPMLNRPPVTITKVIRINYFPILSIKYLSKANIYLFKKSTLETLGKWVEYVQ